MAADSSDSMARAASRPRPQAGGSGRVSVLEQTLWRQLVEGTSAEDIAEAWLTLQCRQLADARCAVLVLRRSEDDRYVPAAYWPEESNGSPSLSAAAERALSRKHPVIHGRKGGSDPAGAAAAGDAIALALPVEVEGAIAAVVAVEFPERPDAELRQAMRQLQWGATWLESAVRRVNAGEERVVHRRTRGTLDVVAAAVESGTYHEACLGTATELAVALGCERVSIGFKTRRYTVVAAISHSVEFGRRMDLVRALGAAMDEAIDQHDIVLYPPPREYDIRISHAHAHMVRRHGAGHVLTVPFQRGDEELGAITFERAEGEPFDQETLDLAECVTAFVGPILDERRRNAQGLWRKIVDAAELQFSRVIGGGFVGRKLGIAAALAAVVFLVFATGTYRVTAPIVLEGEVQRAVVASFDGFVRSQHARAGDRVKAGQLLAVLDDRDLLLQRSSQVATRQQSLKEYDRALADHDRAQAAIVKAKIEQAEAQIGLIDARLKRAELRAPFDGLVLSGDLSQSVGGAVQRGQVLFEVAPLSSYRVIIQVDESDMDGVAAGEKGAIVITSLPGTPFPVTVTKVTPLTEAKEGHNYFRVEARLDGPSDRLRPGMEGIGKIEVGERRLAWIWSRRLINWLRLAMWRYLP